MPLPPGFLEELRRRVPISEIVGRRVRWDARRSNPARGDFWACCPFHEEKSPSFHVDDRRGFYHCFGCHAKGDAVTFLRERENMSFLEAVETLAQAAGLAMPAQDPVSAAKAAARRDLAEWTEAAAAFYRARLGGPEGAAARAYLARRGLKPETLEGFGVGYAPPTRQALTDHLLARGATEQALLDAGLVGRPEGGGAVYDRFRDRVTFPIRDTRGVCIGFGARGLTADAKPKYLNSPDCALFDKSRTLFNLGSARVAAAKAGALIAVEGYMDVVALVEAGIAHAVAPMGTAVTEAHLEAMWRVSDEPIIALDGDAAGLSAAMRVIDVALPHLKPGRSLRFALLPPGRDPDDIIRSEGAAAMRRLLDAAEPLVALLWRRETEGRVFDSPERRAALEARLRALTGAIADPSVRSHYEAALRERRQALFRPPSRAPAPREGRRAAFAPSGALPQTRASLIARNPEASDALRGLEAAILLALLNHPTLVDACGEEVALARFTQPDLDALRGAIISALGEAGELRPALLAAVGADPAEALRAAASAAHLAFAVAGLEIAGSGLREALARHAAEVRRRDEAAEAEAALAGTAGEEIGVRLAAAVASADRDGKGRLPAETNTDLDEAEAARARALATLAAKANRRQRGTNH